VTRIALVCAVLLAAACGKKEQSFRDAVALVCEAPTQIPDGRTRLTEAIMAVDAKVTNAKARELFARLPMVEPGEKLPLLRATVKEAGLARCTLLQIWEEQLKNPPRLPPDPLKEPLPDGPPPFAK
jgi:hypothetical protein